MVYISILLLCAFFSLQLRSSKALKKMILDSAMSYDQHSTYIPKVKLKFQNLKWNNFPSFDRISQTNHSNERIFQTNSSKLIYLTFKLWTHFQEIVFSELTNTYHCDNPIFRTFERIWKLIRSVTHSKAM